MKVLKRLFLVLVFTTLAAVCHSQLFTANEFINLAYKDKASLKNYLEKKGYSFKFIDTQDFSREDIFVGNNGMNVSFITQSYGNGQTLICWEFIGMNDVYANLPKQIISEGFRKQESEIRNSSKYISTTYSKPGISIILSKDKTEDLRGIYRLSLRYFNQSKYQKVK